ncbi:MAG: hypothetical protein ACJAYY_001124 [Paraglaciecola sp.]|jgi:hypothetical protein
MNLKIEYLDEIVINSKALTVNEIMTKVFQNFKKNHFVEPVYYKFYNGVVKYTDKDSTLIALKEYAGAIKQGKLHFTTYNIEKGRTKFFGKNAKQLAKEHRLISMTKMYIDNMFKYREDYTKKKGKRIYEYKLIKRSTILGRNCYVISFDTDKDNYNRKGDLFIDMDNFAVVRKVNRSKKDNRILKDKTINII